MLGALRGAMLGAICGAYAAQAIKHLAGDGLGGVGIAVGVRLFSEEMVNQDYAIR